MIVPKTFRQILKGLWIKDSGQSCTDHHAVFSLQFANQINTRKHRTIRIISSTFTRCSQIASTVFIRLYPSSSVPKTFRPLNTFIGLDGLTYVIARASDGRILGRIELNKFKQMFGRSAQPTRLLENRRRGGLETRVGRFFGWLCRLVPDWVARLDAVRTDNRD